MRITIHIEQLVNESHTQNLRIMTNGTDLKEILGNTRTDFTSSEMRTVKGGQVSKFDRFIMYYIVHYLEKRGFGLSREYIPAKDPKAEAK